MTNSKTEMDVANLAKQAHFRVKNGEFVDAEYFFKKITKVDENNWQAWFGRGLCFKRLEMYERAIFCFDKVTQLDPNNYKAWYNLGFCNTQRGMTEDALYQLNKAIKLEPSFAIAQTIKAWVYKEHNNVITSRKLLDHVRVSYPDFIEKFQQKIPEKEPLDYQIAHSLFFS